MSSTQTQTNSDTRSIVVDFDVPQAPQRVWRALTESSLIEQWLMPNSFQPTVGHQFQFKTQPVAGWDGTVQCEVLTVEPEKRLAYTWSGGSSEIQGYGHRLDTTVTWTLEPTSSGGTHVRLEHTGFGPEDTFAYENMGNGWRSNVATALARVAAQLE
jgi:uncharacterized protein YndB with AHSA1/START domain